jgi:hypothetical protein
VDLESQLNLRADAKAVAKLLAKHGGRLVADAEDAGTYWLEMHPCSVPAETYVARVQWTRYPGSPPSVKFATEVGGRVDALTAWPVVPGYRPTAFDICMPFTAEGFTVHPEWTTSKEAWSGSGNPFLWVAETLQRDLNNRYQGRYQP